MLHPEQSLGIVTALYAGIPNRFPLSHKPVLFLRVPGYCLCSRGNYLRPPRYRIGRWDRTHEYGTRGGIRPNPDLVLDPHVSKVYTSMGQTAENVATRFNISREDQDLFGYNSMKKAAAAMQGGKFKDEIVPVPVKMTTLGPDGKPVTKEIIYDYEEGIRYDVSLEAMAKLRPAFVPGGSDRANSSQTTDGAAAVMVMSKEKALELGIKPRLKFVAFAVAGCDPAIMGVGPVYAIPKVLKRTGLELKDIGLIELNEAFASQSLYCIRTLGINEEIVNVNGGAIALGHPLGCTGAKLTATLMYEMERRDVKYGMVTMCIGGGQGAATIFELIK